MGCAVPSTGSALSHGVGTGVAGGDVVKLFVFSKGPSL